MDRVYFFTEFKQQEWALVGGCSTIIISSLSIYFSVEFYGVCGFDSVDVVPICLVGNLFVQLQYWNEIVFFWCSFGSDVRTAGATDCYVNCVWLHLCGKYGLAMGTKRSEFGWFDWSFWKQWGLTLKGDKELWQKVWWELFILDAVCDFGRITMERWMSNEFFGLYYLNVLVRLHLQRAWAQICYVLQGFNYSCIVENMNLYSDQWTSTKIDLTDDYIWWNYKTNCWNNFEKTKWFKRHRILVLLASMRYYDIGKSVSLGSLELFQKKNL